MSKHKSFDYSFTEVGYYLLHDSSDFTACFFRKLKTNIATGIYEILFIIKNRLPIYQTFIT